MYGALPAKIKVALRKESVDRNVFLTLTVRNVSMSLSARRAWIEMMKCQAKKYSGLVALRKESVDRNTMRRDFKALGLLSLSARRAWIEMKPLPRPLPIGASRPPQGERG